MNVACGGSKYTLPAVRNFMELAGYIPMGGWNHLSYPETLDFIYVERV